MKSLLEIRAVVHAIEFALERGGFRRHRDLERAARKLLRELRSSGGHAGRLLRVVEAIQSGATLEQLMRITGASRRSVFRYLNQLEDEGIELSVTKGVYTIVAPT